MASKSNSIENLIAASQSAQYQALSQKDRVLIEALLVDRGILSAVGTPTPSPSPAPSPTPTTTTTTTTTMNPIVRLAMTTVKPGDLITASFMNTIVDALFALDERLTRLEAPKPASGPAPAPSPTSPASSAQTSIKEAASEFVVGREARFAIRAQPTIEAAVATTVKGLGVRVEVTGDNIGQGLVGSVVLGETRYAPASLIFTRAGFNFVTTTTVIRAAKNRLTVVTSAGQDSATIRTAAPQEPVR
jgi:hypothetical protein